MGTDNPKVSAYVPQVLKERLKQFREKHGISESQAVTVILAEYFQVPEVLGRSPQDSLVGGVTLARMESLEERLVDFTVSVEHRLQQLGEEIKKISELSAVHQTIPDEVSSESEQSDSLPSELPVVEEVVEKADETPTSNQESEPIIAIDEEQVSSLPGKPLTEPLNQGNNEGEKVEATQEVDNSNPLDESRPELSLLSEPLNSLLSKPLSGKIMAKRLGYHPDSLSKVKTRSTNEAFIALSTDKDPDGIGWKFAKEGKGYLPASELSGELQDKLLTWLKENFPEFSP